MKKYLFIIITVLVGIVGLLCNAYRQEKECRQRAERNVSALNADITHYMTKNGEMVAQIAGLELSEKELKKLIPVLHAEISDLNVKLKNALSVARVETEIKYVNQDSIIYIPVGDSLRTFEIDEKFIHVRVSVKDCSTILPGGFEILNIPNTFTAVPEVKYRGWWLWKRPVAVNLHVKCSNPYMNLTDGIFVDLNGRR